LLKNEFLESEICFRHDHEVCFLTAVTNFWQKFLFEIFRFSKIIKIQNLTILDRNFYYHRNFYQNIFVLKCNQSINSSLTEMIFDLVHYWPKLSNFSKKHFCFFIFRPKIIFFLWSCPTLKKNSKNVELNIKFSKKSQNNIFDSSDIHKNTIIFQNPSAVRRCSQSWRSKPVLNKNFERLLKNSHNSKTPVKTIVQKVSPKWSVFLSRSLKSGSSFSANHPCIRASTHFLDGFDTFWRCEKTPRRWWRRPWEWGAYIRFYR